MTAPRRAIAKLSAASNRIRLRLPAVVRPLESDVECSVCGRSFRHFLTHRGQPNAICPWCGARARHRLLWRYLIDERALVRSESMLHLSPETMISCRVGRWTSGSRYVQADLEPCYDLALDITRLPFPDGAFDLILCCHVLEHIPDDAAAMRELGRVTSASGRALVQVPYTEAMNTEEDPTASPAQRSIRFGQEDHVRQYGRDIVDRFHSAGLAVELVTSHDVSDGHRLGLPPGEVVFVCRPT